jgi:uncharacterized protein with HEPN domain
MATNRTVEQLLDDIIRHGERLARRLQGVSREQFLSNELIQDAASKCVEPVGGAAGELARLDPSMETRHPDLRLSDAYAARNRLSSDVSARGLRR